MQWLRGVGPALVFVVTATAGADAKGGERVATTNETTPAERAVVAGNTRFAIDLYARLRNGPGNLFFSPYSISTALAMTSAGARGETARRMAATLHLPDDPAQTSAGFGALVARVNGEGLPQPRPDTLNTANALWLQSGEAFSPAFLETVQSRFGAGLFPVDFTADTEAARKTINAWVEKQTRDKIRDLVGRGVLTRETSVVLTNAIYFKGAWQSPFKEAATRKDGTFHAPGGRDVTVPMMAQTGSFRYLDGGTFQAVEMPYHGNERAMVVLLPKQVDGLGALEASLTEENLAGWLHALVSRRVNVGMPRFTLSEGFELREVLVALGMADAFDPARADFSGMTGRRDHSITAVVHKAFVDVNEAGTEAAAATAVVMKRAMAFMGPEPVPFHADHPFIVLIRDQATGSVLFLGRVVNPKP
jgi:serpin B